jgi:hypothetical protein
MISLDGQRRKERAGSEKEKEKEKEGEEGEVDQVERFLGMVNWGNVPKPSEWDGEFDDAAEQKGGEVEDINALAEKLGAVDMTKSA